MFIMHMAFGGCLKAPPVAYGLTEDTGGHIAYILGAATEQARSDDVDRIEILTRAFDDAVLGRAHAALRERVDAVTEIIRLQTARRDYLAKDALEAELPALEGALLEHLGAGRRPDVIHAHFADAAQLALTARERWGIPVVYTPHSLGLDKCGGFVGDESGALARRIARERDAIARADAIVVSSRDEVERQLDAYGIACAGRVHRLNPGVYLAGDTGGTDGAASLLDPSLREPDRPLILAIARPVAKKNLPALLDAYATTPDLRDAANVAIVAGHSTNPSGAPVGDALRTRVRRHGLEGRVALPPSHDAAVVPQLYRLAARRGGVFVNPALHEPFGLTVIEAAAAGLPVVCTSRGGPSDIVAALRHGECVAPDDVAGLGRAILRTIFDRALWAARSAAGRAGLEQYSWRTYAARSVSLYARLARPVAVPLEKGKVRRLLVCDIDGTLTGDRKAARRFATWAATGTLPFVVATGRSLPEARRVLAAWGLPEPRTMITAVGSEVWHVDAAGCAEMDRRYAATIAEDWDVDAVDAVLGRIDAHPQAALEQRAFKRSFRGDVHEAERIAEALRTARVFARVVASHGDLIDVLPSRAGKAAAMGYVARAMGLSTAACIAAGDSGNDACMLEAAGAAILPANALPELARLRTRGIMLRTVASHADGVMEGLGRLRLLPDPRRPVAPRAAARRTVPA